MELLKTDGCSPKDRMRKATEKWKEAKEAKEKKAADPKTEESVAE